MADGMVLGHQRAVRVDAAAARRPCRRLVRPQCGSGLFSLRRSRAPRFSSALNLLPSGRRKEALAEASTPDVSTRNSPGAACPSMTRPQKSYARVVADRTRAGLPISTEDAQIAAISLKQGLPLVTRNVKDFYKHSGTAPYRSVERRLRRLRVNGCEIRGEGAPPTGEVSGDVGGPPSGRRGGGSRGLAARDGAKFGARAPLLR